MTFTKTLAASGSYDISTEGARILDIQVTNRGPGSVYSGDIPPAAQARHASATSGNTYIDIVKSLGSADGSEAGASGIEEGMAVTAAANIGAGAVVTKVVGNRVHLSVANTDSEGGFAVTFTPPAISTSNGHELAPGETLRRSAAEMAMRNQHGLRFVADASGADLTISKTRG